MLRSLFGRREDPVKESMILVGVIFLAFGLLPVCAPHEPEPMIYSEPAFDRKAEEEAVRDAAEKVMAAFNAHDADCLLSLMDEDFETWWGDASGLEEAGPWVKSIFETLPDLHVEFKKEVGIDFLAPDVAVYKAYREVAGESGVKGAAEFRITAWVFRKRNGEWLYRTFFHRKEDPSRAG